MRRNLLTLAMLLTGVGAWAQETQTLELTPTQFQNGSSTYTKNVASQDSWYGKLVTGTTPAVTIASTDATTNNIGWASNQPWLKAGYTYNITVPAGYKIKAYELTTKNALEFTGTYTYTTSTTPATSPAQSATLQTVSADNLDVSEIQLVVGDATDGNNGILINKLSIEYVLDGVPTTISYTITDNAGKAYTGSYTGVAGVEIPTFTGAEGYILENIQWDGSTMSADITFPFQVSENGGLTNPIMISSFSADGFKWYASGDGIRVTKNLAVTVANVNNCLWAVYPMFNEGAFSFNVKNIATGKYIYSTSEADSHDAGAVILSDTPSDLTLDVNNQFKFSTGKYISVGTTTLTEEQIVGTCYAHNGTKNKFLAPTFTFTIVDGYATIYSPCAFTLPENLKAYEVTEATDGVAYLTEHSDVPAAEGALLAGADGDYTLTVVGQATSNWDNNLLNGSFEEEQVPGFYGSIYILAKPEGKEVGFYKAALTDGLFTNSPNKAYFSIFGSNARFLFNFGTETGIECIDEVESESTGGAVYDLSGRRVQGAQKGLYIVNGKVVIK